MSTRRWLGALVGLAAQITSVASDAGAQPASRPWLGIAMGKARQGPGVVVGHVVRGSPADASGLREGDRIVRVGAAVVSTGQDVIEAVAAHAVGDGLDVAYLRAGAKEAMVHAVLAPFPSPEAVLRMDLVGTRAPAWGAIRSVGGAFPQNLADLRGRVVLVDFWATWCAPCRVVIPVLSQLQARHGAEGLTVVGLSSEDAETVLAFVHKQTPRYAIGLDPEADVARRYGASSLPTVVAIDREGTVRDVFVGYAPDEEARLEATVRPLLAEPLSSP